MNEVTKLYKNAGIEKYYCSFESCDGNVYNWELNEDGEEKYNKCFIGKPKIKQRSFTAEKQLELFLLVTSLGVCEIEDWKEKGFHFAIKRKNIYPTTFLSLSNINFEETLADIINNLWQDLTEEERKQVKGILE